MMHFSNPNLLLYIGMADAYAMSCEYIKLPRDAATLEEALRFERYVRNPRYNLQAGTYTDDTEMSVANARVLIEKRYPFHALDFAESYVQEFLHGGMRNGYSRGFQRFLESVSSGREFLQEIRPESDKNGAAMRAVPFGVLPTIYETIDAATLQARITHDTPSGRFSSRMVALMAHYALYEGGPLSDVGAYCAKHLLQHDNVFLKEILETPWPNDRPVVGSPDKPVSVTTVHAVATLVMTGTSLMDILERVLRMGGDTDSVAAIAWGIASCRFQDEALPEFLERDLEHRKSADLHAIGTALMDAYA